MLYEVITRLRIAVFRGHEPALQRQRAARQVAERVLAAARPAGDRGRADQSARGEVGAGSAQPAQAAGKLAIDDDRILHVGGSDADPFLGLLVLLRDGADRDQCESYNFV